MLTRRNWNRTGRNAQESRGRFDRRMVPLVLVFNLRNPIGQLIPLILMRIKNAATAFQFCSGMHVIRRLPALSFPLLLQAAPPHPAVASW